MVGARFLDQRGGLSTVRHHLSSNLGSVSKGCILLIGLVFAGT